MRRTWRKAPPKQEKRFRVNEQIRVPEVFLIADDGEQIGVMSIEEALQKAEDEGLDLVEVNPLGQPPVVKVMDYGQFRYEKEKKAHKQKLQQKKLETKVVRLSVRIGTHDMLFRVEQGVKFLQKGHKLKVELFLKGREKAHPEKAVELMNAFVAELEKAEGLNIVRDQDLTRQGGGFIMILVNKND